MNNEKICLIYPPLSVNEFPHLALPTLKSYLTSNGFPNTVIQDFNVTIMDRYIRGGFSKIEKYFNDHGMNTDRDKLLKDYDHAREILREKECGRDGRAMTLINTYLRIAGSNIFDVCFLPETLSKLEQGIENYDINEDNMIMKYIKDEVMPYFQENPAKIIGITIPFTSQIYYAFIIGKELKKRYPDVNIVMGGPQISMFGHIFAKHEGFRSSFDGMLRGLGEISLIKYVDCVLNGGDLHRVPSLLYYDENEMLSINEEVEKAPVDTLLLPDFSDLPLERYVYPKIPYQMARGCYWGRCAFCSYKEVKDYDARPTEVILDELEKLKSIYNIRMFHFIDDALKPDKIKDFAEQVIARNMDITYEAYLRLDRGFTPDICTLLKKSGLKSVLFGFESANQRVLNLMNKGNTPKITKQVLYNMKQAGIQNVLSCLIGFPSESREEAWESINFLAKNKELYDQVFIVKFGMISDMYKQKEKYKIAWINMEDLVRYDDTGFIAIGYPFDTTEGMKEQEAFEVIREGREKLEISIFPDNFFV